METGQQEGIENMKEFIKLERSNFGSGIESHR